MKSTYARTDPVISAHHVTQSTVYMYVILQIHTRSDVFLYASVYTQLKHHWAAQ